jgi:hypothetical protein
MATRNLGQVSAIHIGASAPSNKNLIWRDISQNPNLWKIWNTLDNNWDVVPSQAVVNSFTALGDTPATYTGQGGKILKVKLNQSGLEFVNETTFSDEIGLATVKNTPLDTDLFGLVDTGLKKVSWANIKVTLKAYFDTLYVSVSDVTSQLIANWNTAFGWGNHAEAGYLTSETDPVFNSHPASNVIDTGSGDNFLSDDGTYKSSPSGGHTIQDATTSYVQRPALKFLGNVEVRDTPTATEVEVIGAGLTPEQSQNLADATEHINGVEEEKHTTGQIMQELALLKLNLPTNSPLHTVLQSIDTFLAGTLNTSEVDSEGWELTEKRLAILEKTIDGIEIAGAAILLDIFAPPGVEAALRDNSGWINETKTLTGDNSLGQLGEKGSMIWLNDRVFAQCTSSVREVSGSATYNRNRAVDVLDPVNNTQDASIANQLDPSYAYPVMTPTGNSTDLGWNLTTQTKVVTGIATKWGMWFVGGISGDGYTYHCYLVSGTTSYWKRTGEPSSISRVIYAATHPTLTGRLLAHDFTTGAYVTQSGDEVTYADQTFYDATSRKYFIKMINSNWERII